MKPLYRCLLIVLVLSLYASASTRASQRGLSVELNKAAAGSWGNYHALIIGVNQYKQWPRLQTAVKDATVIRNTLVELYGFAPKNVILRTDNAANRLQITRDLRYLAQSMRPDDNLLIYYAGHGQLDDLTGDGYWVPVEGALKDPATWVANSYIKAILSSEKVQAKNVVVIADSCYSGSMLRGGPSLMSLDDQRYREKLAEKAALRSRQVISSGGVEPVADGGAEGHSLFAFYLIDALRKNDREVIDLENLFHTKVWKPVTEIGDQRPNVGRLKTPMDQDGQFVLYNAAWTRKQQARRAAAEAERQKQIQAQQKAAVASAELELQRQRIEMEKQKLALEKEQLARKQKLEEERLAIERQKQKIEYARLQARLKEMENRQVMAAVAPTVVHPAKSVNRDPKPVASNLGDVGTDGTFTKYSTGIIYDKKTGLEWYIGPDEDTRWLDADKWVKGLDIDGGDWRLPLKSELMSLYNPKAGKRKLSPLLKTSGMWFWSWTDHTYEHPNAYYFGGYPRHEYMPKVAENNQYACNRSTRRKKYFSR